jgi:hypothetical protein
VAEARLESGGSSRFLKGFPYGGFLDVEFRSKPFAKSDFDHLSPHRVSPKFSYGFADVFQLASGYIILSGCQHL